MLREAFKVALSGTPGPVFVELPIDILYSYMEIAAGMGLYERKRRKLLRLDEYDRLVIPGTIKSSLKLLLCLI